MKDNSGPAFPTDFDMSSFKHDNQGMTLRQYFAGQAMNGILANGIDLPDSESLRVQAYQYADAMLKQGEGE